MQPPRPVLVTRPEPEAAHWTAALRLRGIAAEPLPLIAIEPLAASPALQQAWAQHQQYAALMFVSRNAVRYFFDKKVSQIHMGHGLLAPEFIANKRFWATGPGTVEALVERGVPADAIDAPAPDATQFDSEALWQVVEHRYQWPTLQVLIVRGQEQPVAEAQEQQSPKQALTHSAAVAVPAPVPARALGRDWLAQRLEQAGAQVHTVAVYQRAQPQFSASQRQRIAAALGDGSIWLLSSSQALRHLQQHIATTQVANTQTDATTSLGQRSCAVATHERIAQAARATGFAHVCTTKPALDAVVQSIKSLHERT